MLQKGELAPELSGLDENGCEVNISDFRGKTLIVYFYPKDSTPGCTAEACNFRDHQTELLHAGCEVIGVSVDSAASHLRFIAKQELNFHLVADTDKKWVEAFGVWGEKKMYGRTYMGTFRTTFIIDAEGRIAHVFAPSDIKTKTHAEQVLKWLEENREA
ncbi:MAG: thioredoxin-dependent thiol peroxidase [Alloprevotella sp.]